MAMVRARGAKFELRVKHKLLPKPFTATFDDEISARNYGEQLEALLAQGVVPQELVATRSRGTSTTLAKLIGEYLTAVSVSALDISILELLRPQIGVVRIDEAVRYKWAEDWVRSLKVEHNIAPGTIRKRAGALARMLDWHLKREAENGEQPLANPLRLLPKNYSTYNDHDKQLVQAAGGKVKTDTERDRRLNDDEEKLIVAALNGEKRPDRQRALALPDGPALFDLFTLIANTGLRLREAYRLRVEHVRLPLRTLHIADSKTGASRDVPILPVIYDMLERRVADARSNGLKAPIFPWWSGADDEAELSKITSQLSRAFSRAFSYAGCEGLTEHDLRHEATCRWVLMRDGAGGWMFRTEEVMRITGHEDPRVFMRYVSLRGSDLAQRLWTSADDANRLRQVG